MKTLFKIFFSALLFAEFFIKSSMPHEYCTISVNGKTVPSLIEWPAIHNFEKPFECKARLVTNKKLYKKYIFPFLQYLKLTKKPVLIWETQFHKTNGNAYSCFEYDSNTPHYILVPAPAHRYISTILHELVHIYIEKKRQSHNCHLKDSIRYRQAYALGFASASFSFLLYTLYTTDDFCAPSLYASIANIHCLVQIWLAFTQKDRLKQLEEIICDSYAGIIFQRAAKNIKIIENDISYFRNDTMRHPEENTFIKNFIADFFCLSTHPSKETRMKHLLAMKELVKRGDSDQIKKWIENQEKILFSDSGPFQSFFVTHL